MGGRQRGQPTLEAGIHAETRDSVSGARARRGRTGTLNSFSTISSSSHRPSSISGIVYSILRHFLPTLERSRGGGWRAGPGESGRKPASSVVGGSLVAGSGKLHVQEGGFGGARDSPQENHDLRSDLAHCALHLRDGYHDHHRAPLTSRDSSEPDCSPTKTEPCCVFPFAGNDSASFPGCPRLAR